MHGLVVPHSHAQPSAYAAADDCQSQERCFRDAPLGAFGFELDLRSSLLTLGIAQTGLALPSLTRSLVYAIHEEGDDIHGDKIDEYELFGYHSFILIR